MYSYPPLHVILSSPHCILLHVNNSLTRKKQLSYPFQLCFIYFSYASPWVHIQWVHLSIGYVQTCVLYSWNKVPPSFSNLYFVFFT